MGEAIDQCGEAILSGRTIAIINVEFSAILCCTVQIYDQFSKMEEENMNLMLRNVYFINSNI